MSLYRDAACRACLPKRFQKNVTDDTKQALCGILLMSICVRLVPIDTDFISKRKMCGLDYVVSRKLIKLPEDDVKRPTEYVDRDEVESLTVLGEKIRFTNCCSLLERRCLCFLTDTARYKIRVADVDEFVVDGDLNNNDGDTNEVVNYSQNGIFNRRQLLGVAFQDATITMAKAFDESVV